MSNHKFPVKSQVEEFRTRGYANDDILPKTEEKRNMSWVNYFTLWMGSVHNIPNYAAVAGFFVLLAPIHVVIALILSGLAVATLMTVNGRAGTKYGIPFSMHLRATYGATGSKLPGVLRGMVAAIAWFGVQCATGASALLILISKIWPGFAEIGGGAEFLGLSAPGWICFVLFWLLNVAIGIGGGGVLNRFTAILSPIIYIVFGAMAVWAVINAGGIGKIFSFDYAGADYGSRNMIFVYLMVIASVMAVWAAPGASVADFTQNAKSQEDQVKGQYLSLFVGYAIFGLMAVCILGGGAIIYGLPENFADANQGGVLYIINNWDSVPAAVVSLGVFLFTTISTNATGNIIPASYQLTALFPKHVNYRRGVIIASIIAFAILPWNLSGGILEFLGIIGALLGPVAGVMVADYYVVKKQEIDLDKLYASEEDLKDPSNPYYGTNMMAYVATIVGLIFSLSGNFISALSAVSEISWIVGFGVAFGLYVILPKKKVQ
ncbi:MAG: allantoin permease [Clostridiaceae bacterium]|nr:allantoin permease [Clostridiaceae bacterium]